MDPFEFKAIPTFGISDYQLAVDFYVGFLDFKIDWEHRFAEDDPVYMQISRNELTLHLSANIRFQSKAIVLVEAKKLKEFHKKLQGKSFSGELPTIVQTKWHTLQLEISDPFGNLLRFNENISKYHS